MAWKRMRQTDPTTAVAAKDDCQAQVKELECELRLEQLRREDRESVAAKQLERQEQKEEKKAERQRERRRARHAWWSNFWKERRKRREEAGGVSGTFRVFLFLGVPAVAALVIYAFALSKDEWEVLAIGLLTAASAFAVGALLGFLFGIPRSVGATAAAGSATPSEAGDEAAASTNPGGDEKASAGVAANQHFTTNTNLEQISDWLTKILVGVGLVQIHQVSGAVEDLADGLAPGLGPQGPTVAVALLVAFSVIGFISGYLYTRLRLQRDFESATGLRQAIEERADTETTAIALVQQQLTPGVEKPGFGELIKALSEATSGVREQAFFLARRQRLEKWSGEGTEMEREEMPGLSAPVFEALIACDPEGNYYRPRAELGFVLLQLDKPDFRAAKAAFDKAIELRPAELIDRTPEYELNRAYCKIEIDDKSKQGQPSPKPLAESVSADLEAVIAYLREVKKEKYEAIREWLEVNKEAAPDELAQQLELLLTRFKGVPSST